MRSALIILLFVGISCILNAQSISRQVIATAGGYYEDDQISISWTIGEPVIETVYSEDKKFILTQGFQQPDLMRFASEPIIQSNDLSVSLFPNPASDELFISIFGSEDNNFNQLELYDILGRQLYVEEIETTPGIRSTYRLSVDHLSAGIYFIRLNDRNANPSTSVKFQKIY